MERGWLSLEKALNFEVEGQQKGKRKRTLEKQVEDESMKDDLRRGDTLCRSK